MAVTFSGSGITFSDNSFQGVSSAPMSLLGVGHTGLFRSTWNDGPFFLGDQFSGSYLWRFASGSGMNRTYYDTAGVWLSGNYINYTSSPVTVGLLGGGSGTFYNLAGTWRVLGSWPIPVPSYDGYYGFTTTWTNLFTRIV